MWYYLVQYNLKWIETKPLTFTLADYTTFILIIDSQYWLFGRWHNGWTVVTTACFLKYLDHKKRSVIKIAQPSFLPALQGVGWPPDQRPVCGTALPGGTGSSPYERGWNFNKTRGKAFIAPTFPHPIVVYTTKIIVYMYLWVLQYKQLLKTIRVHMKHGDWHMFACQASTQNI